MNGLKFVFPSNVWERVKLSRFTALYIIFIVVSSFTQIGLRSYVFARDSSAQATLETYLIAGRARSGGIPVLTSTPSIRTCQSLTFPGEEESCSELWSPSSSVHVIGRQDSIAASDPTCLLALNYPSYILREDIHEDTVTLTLQLFSLALGFIAMAQNHISHFVTGSLIQVISVAWAAIRVRDTGISSADFDKVIANGACGGQILGNFWQQRWGLDVAVLAINVLCALLSLVFSFKAAQNLGLTHVSSPQVSSSTNHIYKVMVAGLVSIELSMFFCLAAGGLWLQQIFFLDDIADLGVGTKVMYSVAEVLMLPVLFLGWVSLHREMWKSVLTFLACSFVYLAGWGMTFIFEAFRWSVNTWTLFGFLAIFSIILSFITFTCTLISACFFGQGMKRISDMDNNSPKGPNVHTIQSFQFRTSDDSLAEKGDYSIEKQISIDSADSRSRSAAPVATLPYQNNNVQRIPKHKATAMARGLTVSPPPP